MFNFLGEGLGVSFCFGKVYDEMCIYMNHFRLNNLKHLLSIVENT